MTDEFEGLFDCLDGSITPGEMRGKPLCLEHVEALFGMIRIEPYWLRPVNPEEIAALSGPEFDAEDGHRDQGDVGAAKGHALGRR